VGGIFHLKLNTTGVPIANKYCEGKVKSTLKRELKVIETMGIERKVGLTVGLCSSPRAKCPSGPVEAASAVLPG
jgi:hypothetical protein